MYICLNCGREFENPHEYEEFVGSFWGDPAYQTFSECPHCSGDFEQAFKCKVCDKYHLEEDLTNGICESCYEKQFDYATALKYLIEKKLLRHFFLVWYWQVASDVTDDENEEFDNTLISIFNAKVQEDKQTFRTAFYSQLKNYILDDIYDWTEFLEKEVNANENSKD